MSMTVATKSSAEIADIAELIGRQRQGWSLEAPFYLDPEIARLDLARVWRRGWLFAGHACEIARPGDYIVRELAGESIVITRARDGRLNALFNVCRHRGSRVCTSAQGSARMLTCPYHGWTYDLNGKLTLDIAAEHGVDRAAFGLHRAALEDVAGLLFVSTADHPAAFVDVRAAIAPAAAPHGFDRAKIAYSATYRVAANWKVIFENNRECYHCPGAHKEYIRANYDVDYSLGRNETEIARRVAESNNRWQRLGLTAASPQSDMTGPWYRCNRTPLVPGFVTESLDGKPVGPLMGTIAEPDSGTLRVTTFPNFWMHASADHAVTTRLSPAGPGETIVDVAWLVAADAEEGRDYWYDRLTPFWKLTSEQDWVLCSSVQAGIGSSRYRPGPLSQKRERNVQGFIDWYLKELSTP